MCYFVRMNSVLLLKPRDVLISIMTRLTCKFMLQWKQHYGEETQSITLYSVLYYTSHSITTADTPHGTVLTVLTLTCGRLQTHNPLTCLDSCWSGFTH